MTKPAPATNSHGETEWPARAGFLYSEKLKQLRRVRRYLRSVIRKLATADTQTRRIVFGCTVSKGQTVKSPKYAVSKLVGCGISI
jgi:hypothetical protein